MNGIDLHVTEKFDFVYGIQYEVNIYIWRDFRIPRSRHFYTKSPEAWRRVGRRLMEIQHVNSKAL